MTWLLLTRGTNCVRDVLRTRSNLITYSSPRNYADNPDRQYGRRLHNPVDGRRDLAINKRLRLNDYIVSENMGIDTCVGLVRRLLGRCIRFGREYARNKNKNGFYEALRLGAGLYSLKIVPLTPTMPNLL